MFLDGQFAEREAHAGVEAAVQGQAGLFERGEQVGDVVGGDTLAVVADGDLHGVGGALDDDEDQAAGGGVFQGVADQVK